MVPLDSLEERIANLEQCLLPISNTTSTGNQTNIMDTLLQVKSMLGIALSHRDAILNITKRFEELNQCLDLNMISDELDHSYTLEYVIELAEELKRFFEAMKEFVPLNIIISSDKSLDAILDLSTQLAEVSSSTGDGYLESLELTRKVHNCIEEVFAITLTLKSIFARMDMELKEE